jgi:D-hexose-6-phosphate mutarotase
MVHEKIEEIKRAVKIPAGVTLETGQGDMPLAKVKTQRSTAEIYLHGAHVTQFQKEGEPPILWMSAKSKFDDLSAIRGGIPVIFPWFGGRAGCPAHGFARVKSWDLKEATQSGNGAVSLRFRLPETAEAGFSGFAAEYTVTVGDALEVKLTVTNSAASGDFKFEACLHSYFTVGEIAATSLKGLKGTKYIDKVDGGAEKTESNDEIKIASETDRVYMDTTAAVEIRDSKLRRKILVEKSGSASTVVWNPWIAKSKAMADFGDEEYHTMVCVESGNVGKNIVTLAPEGSRIIATKISSVSL